MGYDKSVYLSAETILKEKKSQAESQAERRRAVFYRECPRAGQIDQILTRTAAAAARAVLNGKDAVSYTHLDVYKRQGPQSSKAQSAHIFYR